MIRELSWAWPQIGRKEAGEPATIPLDLPTLVHLHSATLFRVANSLLRDRTEAEDVVQDTFLRVLQNQTKLPAIRDLRPWLIRIAWNLALDRRRRIRPDQADETFLAALISQSTPADQTLGEAQQMHQTLAALDRLPAPERQVLLLSALQELETTEIAQIMNKSESAVRALLHRARTRLRERLGQSPQKGVSR